MSERILNQNFNLNSNLNESTFNIKIIPKEKIKYSSKLYNNFNQDLSLNESFSISRERKIFYLKNITSLLNKQNFEEFLKVNFYFLNFMFAKIKLNGYKNSSKI